MKKHLRYYFIAMVIVVLVLFFNLSGKKSISKNLPRISETTQITPNEISTTLTDSYSILDNSNPIHATSRNNVLDDTSPIKTLTQAECANFFNSMQYYP